MQKRRWAVIVICFAIAGLMLTTASCSKKKGGMRKSGYSEGSVAQTGRQNRRF